MSETRQINRRSWLAHAKLVVPPGKRDYIRATGRTLVCTEATHGFKLCLGESGQMMDWNLGLKFTLLPGDYFSAITVENPDDSETLVVEFLLGDGDIEDARLNIVRERGMPYKGVETKFVTHPETELAYNASIDCPGHQPAGSGLSYRKEIIITNADPLNNLEIIDTDSGVSIGLVLARTAWCLETSADLRVKNPNAETVPLRVAETFYLE